MIALAQVPEDEATEIFIAQKSISKQTHYTLAARRTLLNPNIRPKRLSRALPAHLPQIRLRVIRQVPIGVEGCEEITRRSTHRPVQGRASSTDVGNSSFQGTSARLR